MRLSELFAICELLWEHTCFVMVLPCHHSSYGPFEMESWIYRNQWWWLDLSAVYTLLVSNKNIICSSLKQFFRQAETVSGSSNPLERWMDWMQWEWPDNKSFARYIVLPTQERVHLVQWWTVTITPHTLWTKTTMDDIECTSKPRQKFLRFNRPSRLIP